MTNNQQALATEQTLKEAVEMTAEDMRLSEEQQERFVSLKTNGAPKAIILETMGITEETYSKLMAKSEIADKIASSEVNRIVNNATLDSNWDMIESSAMTVVHQALASCPDPDYALRVAAVANKAVRRRREELKQISENQFNSVVTNNISVISLPKTIINELQNANLTEIRSQAQVQKEATEIVKFTDVADVQKTREVLDCSAEEAANFSVTELEQICANTKTTEDFLGGLPNGFQLRNQ